MENGHVEIHDPLSGCNGLSSNTDCDPKPTDPSDPESTEDMVEFKILMAYAKRRRQKDTESTTKGSPDTPNGNLDSHGTPSPQAPDKTEEVAEKKKRKKQGFKRFSKIFTCFKPQMKEDEPSRRNEDHRDVENRCLVSDGGKKEQRLEAVASRLTEISDEIPFVHPEVETDAPDDDVEKVIGLLLRDVGDKLNKRVLDDAAQLLVDYSFFEKVVVVFLKTLGLWTSNTDGLGPKTSTETQIAVTCEVTSRLSVLETLPTNRLLGHGAQYLRTHFSPWAEQQGGYDKVFDSEDQDDVQ